MKTPSSWTWVAVGLGLFGAACLQTNHTPPPPSVAPATAAPATRPVPDHQHSPAPVAAVAASSGSPVLQFTDAARQTKQFIGYYRTIKLTPEQERIKVEALSALAAPCCSKFTLATCCCPCNMSKAVWGMAAWLITEKGQGVEQVRQAAVDWLAFVNPNGFSGEACTKGRCNRPTAHDGCGGMNEAELL